MVTRRVHGKSHKSTANKTCNWDGHDPGEEQKANTLPVDSLVGTIAQSDSNGSTSDAHGGGDRKLVLGEDEDGNSGTHLHRRSTRWRMVCELVTHDLHDVVSVCDETEANGEGHDRNLPKGNLLLRLDGQAGLPCAVHTSPNTDGVSDIVSTVSERGGTGSDDLDERVEIFDLVLIFGGVGVNSLHAAAFRGAENTDLGAMDIVVDTVE